MNHETVLDLNPEAAQNPVDNYAYLLQDGESLAQTTFELIRSAQHEVISLEFLLRDDEFGLTKLALLRKKAREGKSVHVHVDAFHFMVNPALAFHLMEEGIHLTIFNKLGLKNLFRFSYRNHCKFLVVDGAKFKTGDSNTGNEYAQWDTEFKMKSIDVVIEGKSAADIREYALKIIKSPYAIKPKIAVAPIEKVLNQRKQVAALSSTAKRVFTALHIQIDAPQNIKSPDKILVTRDEVESAKKKLDQFESHYKIQSLTFMDEPRERLEVPSLVFFCDPILEKGYKSGVEKPILDFFNSTRDKLIIVSPYMILTPTFKSCLRELLRKGVRVEFYTNSLQSTDNETTQLAYEYRLKEIIDIGPINIYEYTGPETLHTKFVIGDMKRSLLMTYNMDWRSELKNLESAILFSSLEVTNKLHEWLETERPRFIQVAEQGNLLKSPISPNCAKDWMKKIIIQSIEKHL
jgi:putative cardiolipin synthase